MFRTSRKIKELEAEIKDLKSLCTQLTNNAIAMIREQALLTQAVKGLLQHQKITDKLINNKYSVISVNDDDDIIN